MSTFMIEITPNPTPTPDQPAVFAPSAQVAYPYDTICWHNGDNEAHFPAPLIENPTTGKVTLQEQGWFDYQIPPGGTSDTLAPGPNSPDASKDYTLNYACALHPKETGTITIKPTSAKPTS